MASKSKSLTDNIEDQINESSTFNPLLNALKENDKKHLFTTNVTTAFIKTGFHLFDYYFGSVVNIHDELGNIIRQEPRVGQAAGTFNLVIGNSGTGKAQPISTKIPTPDGYKLMGDLKIGDKVFGSNGKPINITGVYPQGIKDIYKITFNDGRTAYSTKDHLWTIYENKSTINTKRLEDIINNFDSSTYEIPTLSAPIQYKEKDNFIIKNTKDADSFILGYSMGSITHCIICDKSNCKDCKLEDPISARIPQKNIEAFIKDSYDVEYNNDIIDRIFLLRGFFKANTKITDNGNEYNIKCLFSDDNKEIIFRIREILLSLGFNDKIKITKNLKSYYRSEVETKKIVHYELEINIKKDSPFIILLTPIDSLDKIDNLMKKLYNLNNRLAIEKIEYSHREEAKCIKVDSDDELYVTEDFILTHNTTLTVQIASNIIRQFKYANIIHYDCEQRFDISRGETISQLPSTFFEDRGNGARYIIKAGAVGLDTMQETIVKIYVSKMKNKEQLITNIGVKDEFGKDVKIFEPTVIIIDSITSVLSETFSPDNTKDVSDAEKMRGNTEGARDAKTLKGFFKDVLPLCKEANIIIYAINHINANMSMHSFTPVAKQQIFLKQDESIPGGKTMIFFPFNIIKLIAKPSDYFTEESDGFAGHIVMIEPIKSSSNQSGNNSKGISFEMVFNFKHGFDALRTLILYGKHRGVIEGTKNRLKFRDDPSFVFSLKNVNKEKEEKPIWENLKKYVIPLLNDHLSYIEPTDNKFDSRSMDY